MDEICRKILIKKLAKKIRIKFGRKKPRE